MCVKHLLWITGSRSGVNTPWGKVLPGAGSYNHFAKDRFFHTNL